jgi:L-glyceraldehyde 3-phosphate reductase
MQLPPQRPHVGRQRDPANLRSRASGNQLRRSTGRAETSPAAILSGAGSISGSCTFDLANNYGPPYGWRRPKLRAALFREDFRPLPRDELVILDEGGVRHVAGPVRRVGLAQVPAREPRPEPRADGLDYVDIFYSHRFDPETPLEETMGALDPPCGRARRSTPASPRTRPRRHAKAAAILRALGSAARDPPAVVLDAEPLDRAGLLDASGGGASAASLLAARSGAPHRQVPDGVPEGSRASRDSRSRRTS